MAEEERGVDRRREVEKGEEVIEEMERELEEEEKEGSLEDLPVFERQTKGRATVCLGDMKPRSVSGQNFFKIMMTYCILSSSAGKN